MVRGIGKITLPTLSPFGRKGDRKIGPFFTATLLIYQKGSAEKNIS
jgi:hypothetical protein